MAGHGSHLRVPQPANGSAMEQRHQLQRLNAGRQAVVATCVLHSWQLD